MDNNSNIQISNYYSGSMNMWLAQNKHASSLSNLNISTTKNFIVKSFG